jgi:DNA-directed RNA polymerase specialized sigma24 family protein
VALRDAGGCSTEQISGLLEVDPGQVRRLLHTGRASLRRSLDVTVARS